MKLTHWVGAFGTSLVVAISLSGCASTPDPTPAPSGSGGGTQLMGIPAFTILSATDAPAGPTPAPAAWTSAGCNVCHGTVGQGVNLLAPEVRHTPAVYAQWIVRHGRAGTGMVDFPLTAMPMKTPLTDQELNDIIAWLEGQPKPLTGEGLYKDFCGNCHGPNMATGGNVPVSLIGKMATLITMRVRVGEGTDPAMRPGYMPPETTAALTDAELALIQQYLMAK